MKKKGIQLIGLVMFILLLAGCGNDKVSPVSINEATDTCDVCNMAVVDNQHASQIVLENGKSLVFDDIGCLNDWLDSNENEKIAAEFVRDYNDKEWVLMDDATYVYNQSIKTPMAYNVLSFKDQASADEFAAEHEGSTVMSASELAQHSWEQNHDMMQKHDMENHSHSETTDSENGDKSH